MATTQVKDGFNGGSDNQLKVNADGSINTNATGVGSFDVNIHDSSGNNINSTGGALDVTIVSTTPTSSTNTYNEISSVVSGSETTIVTYTAPPGKASYLSFIEAAGQNIAAFRVFQNAGVLSKKYTYFGGELNADFDFRNNEEAAPGLFLNVGDTVTVKVLHNRPSTADFNARIQVIEVG